MNNNPKITIITVCYNSEKDIEKTILSVISQSYNNIEYIIIDGGSKDRTVEIIKKYGKNISYWISEKDNGIYDAMNKGIQKSTGEYIQFLNAGDELENNDLIRELFYNNYDTSQKNIIYGDIIFKNKIKQIYKKPKKLELFKSKKFPIFHPSTFIQSEILKNHQFNLKYKLAADYELLFKLYNLNYEFYYIPKAFVIFDTTGVSSTKSIALFKEGNSINSKTPYYLKVKYYSLLAKRLIKYIINRK